MEMIQMTDTSGQTVIYSEQAYDNLVKEAAEVGKMLSSAKRVQVQTGVTNGKSLPSGQRLAGHLSKVRSAAVLLLFLLLAQSASAGPKDWIAHHKRFLFMEGAAITGASIHAAGLHHCRHYAGVEACDTHYGAAWAAFGVTSGFTVIVMPAVAEGCWKNQGGKFCNIFAYTGTAAQTGWGIHEWSIRAKTDSH